MSTARDYLTAVQQRAVEQRHDRHLLGTPETQAEKDRAALVAALTAALDLADGPYTRWVEDGPEGGPAMIPAATLLAVITAALTPKEND